MCAPFVSPAFRRVCLPYVPATTEQVKNIFTGLRERSGSLIDLGSGDGRIVSFTVLEHLFVIMQFNFFDFDSYELKNDLCFMEFLKVIEAAKRGFQGVGIELNPWLVWFSKLNALRLGVAPSASFQRKDIFKTSLKSYDNVVIFGVDSMVKFKTLDALFMPI